MDEKSGFIEHIFIWLSMRAKILNVFVFVLVSFISIVLILQSTGDGGSTKVNSFVYFMVGIFKTTYILPVIV